MTALLLIPIFAPATASVVAAMGGWNRFTATLTTISAASILTCGIASGLRVGDAPIAAAGGALRADGLSVTMTIVIGAVGTLAALSSIGYIKAELTDGHTTLHDARIYGALVPAFMGAMTLAVSANNAGIIWVAIEATTVITAFLVGHRRTRTALEATWKYVIICSVGIAIAFLGTILLYFAALHAGADPAHALDLDVVLEIAGQLDPRVTKLALALMLIGYGAKAGLVPFHTWLADAHSQAPSPISALMSGVLLSVALSVILRLRPIADVAAGPAFYRTGLVVMGLLTIAVAALLLTVTTDLKRLLAYSSMENIGILALAAAAGTKLAIAALLLHVLAHGLGKATLFLTGGQLQIAYRGATVGRMSGVLRRSPFVGISFAIGAIVLVGMPPGAIFASEVSIARAMASAGLGWALAIAFVLIAIAFAALVRNSAMVLLGDTDGPAIALPFTIGAALVLGVVASLVLGITAIGPLTGLFDVAATQLGTLP
ncbi:MAG: hydrogenase [Nocardiaceae bacterium]|nr:hydrogenase [Nocardiaceae bacterium]